MPTYAPAPVRFVSGRGTELFDDEGRRYLDFLAGIAVVSLGHANARVVDAIARQAARGSCMYRTCSITSSTSVWLVTWTVLSGTEQRLEARCSSRTPAQRRTNPRSSLPRRVGGPGRYVVISALGSFHGRTLATLAATGQPKKHEAFRPLPEGFTSVALRRRGCPRACCRLTSGHGRSPRGHPRRGRSRGPAGRLPDGGTAPV